MKRVQKMVIGSEFAPQADKATHLSTAAVGEVGIFDEETGLAATPGASIVTVVAVCEDSDGNRYLEESSPINISGVTSNGYAANAPSTPKIAQIDMSTVVVSAGAVYAIFITDYNDYNYIIGRRRIAYEARPGDVLADVVTGLVDAINNDVSIPNVTAVDAGGNLINVTGAPVQGSGNVINNFRADYEILFEVILSENLFGVATVDNLFQVADKGCGTGREVRKMEEIHKGYKGHLNRVIYPSSVNIQYKSDPNVDYDLYVIEYKAPQYTVTEGDVHFQVSLTVAAPTGTGNIGPAGGTTFTDVFEALL